MPAGRVSSATNWPVSSAPIVDVDGAPLAIPSSAPVAATNTCRSASPQLWILNTTRAVPPGQTSETTGGSSFGSQQACGRAHVHEVVARATWATDFVSLPTRSTRVVTDRSTRLPRSRADSTASATIVELKRSVTWELPSSPFGAAFVATAICQAREAAHRSGVGQAATGHGRCDPARGSRPGGCALGQWSPRLVRAGRLRIRSTPGPILRVARRVRQRTVQVGRCHYRGSSGRHRSRSRRHLPSSRRTPRCREHQQARSRG